jgi:hypothetical protein
MFLSHATTYRLLQGGSMGERMSPNRRHEEYRDRSNRTVAHSRCITSTEVTTILPSLAVPKKHTPGTCRQMPR